MVDSGKVLDHFLFGHVGWAYSDTVFFPSHSANLKSVKSVKLSWLQHDFDRQQAVSWENFLCSAGSETCLVPCQLPSKSTGTWEPGPGTSQVCIAVTCSYWSCGCDKTQLVGCSETRLSPLKLCTSHFFEYLWPHLPRLRPLTEDFSRNADKKYKYLMACQTLTMLTHSFGCMWQVIYLGPTSLHQQVCSRFNR